MLTQVKFVKNDKYNRTINLYRCSCGNTKEIVEYNVIKNLIKSCGCLRKQSRKRSSTCKGYHGFEDLTNKKFHSLTAISLTKTTPTGSYWLWKCDCGKEKEIRASNVKRGTPKSCGCLNRTVKVQKPKKHCGRLITYNGLTLNIKEWGQKFSIHPTTLRKRLKDGLSIEEALNYQKQYTPNKDITGIKYGELIAIKYLGKGLWLWQCECGEEIKATKKQIELRLDKSCGHYRRKCKVLSKRLQGFKKRCYVKTCKAYPNYGGRGITVCDEWNKNPQSFYKWAFENGFKPELHCDRIDNDGPYSPENCRFISCKYNQNNKRTNKYITFNNKTQTIAQWSEELNIPYRILQEMLYKDYKFEDIIGDGTLKIIGLDNKEYNLLLSKIIIDNQSSLHIRARRILKEIYPDIPKYEEILLPSSSTKNGFLRADFLIPNKNLIIEVDGEQHYRQISKFGGIKNFQYQQLKDKNKDKWAALNNFKLIRLPFDENEEQWKDRIIQLLPNKTIFEFKQKSGRRNLNYDVQYEYCGQLKTMREWADTLCITKYTLDKRFKESNNILDNRVISPALFYCDVKYAWAEKIKLNGELLYIWEWSKKLGRPEEEIVSDFQNNKSIFEIFQLKS